MIPLVPMHLTCEYRTNPLGVDARTPRLSWVLEFAQRGERQTAYRIWVADSPQALAQNKGDLWDSGKVASSQSVTVPYVGKLLTSGEHCYWKVQVWDGNGQPSPASAITTWQMGLLKPSDWRARWVSGTAPRGAADADGLVLPPCPLLRRTFTLAKPVKEATLYATARGLYELHLNGAKIGDAKLAPGWTDYHRRIQYQVYDVTRQLHAGPNAVGAILGDGWYSGYIGYSHKRDYYGDRPALKAQINIVYADGTRQTVTTDGAWRSSLGPLLHSDLLQGEAYDARREQGGWDRPGFADTSWQPVAVTPDDFALLVGSHGPPVRVTQDLSPRKITQPTPGTYIFDLGQNMVGWARLRLQAPAGTQIQLRFGEMLNPDGTLYTANLRAARATDLYTCRGGRGVETWEPRFTFHGFRYVEVTGLTAAPTTTTVTGRVVGSDIAPTGTFACSSALVNQLQHNIVWGQRGNFLSVPTDCPQRDERLGWMGDAQIFARTATFNRDVAAFYEKWTQDVDDAQSPAGGFAAVSPRVVNNSDGAPAWGDAGIIVPWTVWQSYGDTRLLAQRWPAMTRWMDYLTSANPNGLWLNRRNQDFGDWLSVGAVTSKDVLATAYYAHDAALMAQMARALGRPLEAAQYEALFAHVKSAFEEAYVQPDGTVQGDTQTGDVLALHFDLLPSALRPLVVRRLVADIAAKNNHLSTGFVGVGYLCPTLTETGHNDVAYKLLLQDTFPSWGYSIRQGATTIWERWDGYTQDKGFQTPSMNSFNHYSLGSVGEWLYRDVAGIDTDPDAPGFAHILIQPHPGPGLTWARATYNSIRGRIASAWKTEGSGLTLDVTIPANTTAIVTLPARPGATVTESGIPAAHAPGITSVHRNGSTILVAVGSGTYHFRVK